MEQVFEQKKLMEASEAIEEQMTIV